jgi:IS30 family transposase
VPRWRGGTHITTTGLPEYFAHQHSPWERGSNENLNRNVREFFPKGVTITPVSTISPS